MRPPSQTCKNQVGRSWVRNARWVVVSQDKGVGGDGRVSNAYALPARRSTSCSRPNDSCLRFSKLQHWAIKVASATERVDRSDVPCPIDFRHFLDDDYGNWDKKWSVSQKIALIRVWAFWKAPRFRAADLMLREKMETLIFALIASLYPGMPIAGSQ